MAKEKKPVDLFALCKNDNKDVKRYVLNGMAAFNFLVDHCTGRQLIEYFEEMAGEFEAVILRRYPALKDIHPVARYIAKHPDFRMAIQHPYSIQNPKLPEIFLAPMLLIMDEKKNGPFVQTFILIELDKEARTITRIIYPTKEQQREFGLMLPGEDKALPQQSTRLN